MTKKSSIMFVNHMKVIIQASMQSYRKFLQKVLVEDNEISDKEKEKIEREIVIMNDFLDKIWKSEDK